MEALKRGDKGGRQRFVRALTTYSRCRLFKQTSHLIWAELRNAVALTFSDGLNVEPIESVGHGLYPWVMPADEKGQVSVEVSPAARRRGKRPREWREMFDDIDKPTRKMMIKHFAALNQRRAARVTSDRETLPGEGDEERRLRKGRAILQWYLPQLRAVLLEAGRSIGTLDDLDDAEIVSLMAHIPSIDVEVECEVQRDKQASRDIDPNDVHDIDFLAVAVPYADAVVTEAFWRDLLRRNGYHEKYGTTILRDIRDLESLQNER